MTRIALPRTARAPSEQAAEAANPVLLARPGFHNAPIGLDEWLAAARKLPALQVRDGAGPGSSAADAPVVCLASDPSAILTLTPFGQVVAPVPSRPLVEAMFALADELQAAVYSKRRNAYASVDDWQNRSRRKRRRAGLLGWRRLKPKQVWQVIGLALVALLSVWVAVQLGLHE